MQRPQSFSVDDTVSRSLVLLQSYPRSGNTLVRHVIDDVFGVPTYTVYPNEGIVLWADRQIEADACPDGLVFLKTHEAHDYSKVRHKTIYLVRDGRDVLLSQAHYFAILHRESGSGDWRTHLSALVNGEGGNWGKHVIGLWDSADVKIRFEELLLDPIAVVRDALWQLGILKDMPLPLGDSLPSFGELHAKYPGFYRKGTVGQWQTDFPPELLQAFWDNHGQGMEVAGYANSLVAV